MSDKVTFTVLADMHYKKGMYLASVSDLEAILQRAESTNSDFVIHCGDFSNDYKGSPELNNTFLDNIEELSVYGVYGNHELETDGNTMQYVTPLLTNRTNEVVWGNKSGKIDDGDIAYYYFDKNNFRIICLDTNYSYNSDLDEWQHNTEASWGPPEGNIYPNSLGPVQLKWFENLLLTSAKEGKLLNAYGAEELHAKAGEHIRFGKVAHRHVKVKRHAALGEEGVEGVGA